MSDLPAPLVPADCDLRDFLWMPIDIARLFGSEFHARSDDTVWRAGVTLFLKCYHQVPAASIPDDDIAMARLAELGRDVKAWREIKSEVLRGWILCSDGRLYHPVVAEKALEAWIEKLTQRKASAAGNAKRYGAIFDPAPFEAVVADSLSRLAALNPNSRTLSKRLPRGAAKAPGGTPDDVPAGAQPPPTGSDEASHRDPAGRENGSQPDATGSPTGSENGSHLAPKGPDPTRPDIIGSSLRSDPARGAGEPTPKRATKQGTRLPGDWTFDDEGRAYAERQGLPAEVIDREAESFRDHWIAEDGPKASKRDWCAAWRTWCRGAVDRRRQRGLPLLVPIQGGAQHAPPSHPAMSRPMSGGASASAGIAATIAAHRGDHDHVRQGGGIWLGVPPCPAGLRLP